MEEWNTFNLTMKPTKTLTSFSLVFVMVCEVYGQVNSTIGHPPLGCTLCRMIQITSWILIFCFSIVFVFNLRKLYMSEYEIQEFAREDCIRSMIKGVFDSVIILSIIPALLVVVFISSRLIEGIIVLVTLSGMLLIRLLLKRIISPEYYCLGLLIGFILVMSGIFILPFILSLLVTGLYSPLINIEPLIGCPNVCSY